MAAAAPPEIQVYASLPRAVALGADLDVDPTNWRWVHCLTLPLETLNALQFSQRPYKWIRYAVGVVVGAEGDLSPSPASPNVVNYNAGLPAASSVLYYHTSNEEKRRMFPADSNIVRTHKTSSVATTRKVQFYDDVAERDGKQCVLTSMEQIYCDAVHLLGHDKGDTYIATYTRRRSREPTGGDIVQDIDSVRNGLFLNAFTHVGLGNGVAFLMTPNFAMNTADVDPTAPPAEKRCTAHLFRPSEPYWLGGTSCPSGSPLRISDTSEWPPAILFDAVYAGAVLHHFGTQELKEGVSATWKDAFHSGGVITGAHGMTTEERAAAAERAEERRVLHEARSGPDALDMLMVLPYILVPRDELQPMLREAKEKAEAAEQGRVKEKVDTWMKGVTDM